MNMLQGIFHANADILRPPPPQHGKNADAGRSDYGGDANQQYEKFYSHVLLESRWKRVATKTRRHQRRSVIFNFLFVPSCLLG
jgi:hypothetical protein